MSPASPSSLSGRALELEGKRVLTSLGLLCIDNLRNAALTELDPAGPHAAGEHLEFDYLVPQDRVCLVGEITSRSDPDAMRDKFDRFRRHLDIVGHAITRDLDGVWEVLGVPAQQRNQFRNVREVRGFVVMTQLQHFDARLPNVAGVVPFDQPQWALLTEYTGAIGAYARPAFLAGFSLPPHPPGRLMLLGDGTAFPLIYAPDRKIAKELSDRADLFTFEASPFDLLERAEVFRRDLLPDVAERTRRKYQRALMTDKLIQLRQLISGPDFSFPTGILLVLSRDCRYEDGQLTIPDQYGAVSVIDGQHRLFSYAEDAVRVRAGENARIMVTSIQFRSPDQREHARNSARIFVEINSNQTRIRPSHIDAIAYDILGWTTARALAAQVILLVNVRPNGKAFGLFDTSQTRLGVVAAPTVMTALQPLVALATIRGLSGAIAGAKARRRQGYEHLFGVTDVAQLENPDVLIERAVVALDRYFGLIARKFRHDWPRRGAENHSTLRHAKVLGAFVKLFQRFVGKGLSWTEVEQQVDQLHTHLMQLQRITSYTRRVFDERYPNRVPNAGPSMNADLRFLVANLSRRTPMADVLAGHARRRSSSG